MQFSSVAFITIQMTRYFLWHTRNTVVLHRTAMLYCPVIFQGHLRCLTVVFVRVIATFRTVNSLTRSSVLPINVLVENCVASIGRTVLSYKFFKKHSQSLRYLSGASDKSLAEEMLLFRSGIYRIQGGWHCIWSSTLLRNTRRCRVCAGSNFNPQVNHYLIRHSS
jgi:hypothetical protein